LSDADVQPRSVLADFVVVRGLEAYENTFGELTRFALDPAHVHSFGTVVVVALPSGMTLVYDINALN
jgi:hypothetical protein